MVKLLELFSGTGSIGTIAKELNYEVISLDKDLDADIKEDILTWNYKIYKPHHFDIITASPVCLYWSSLRNCWIGRKIKSHPNVIFTKELLQKDIDEKGKPMVDKVREIINYFKPKYWWIENPKTGKMKNYITDLEYYDVDYCKYGFPYRKRTRFWTNIKGFEPKKCKKDCGFIVETPCEKKIHLKNCGNSLRARLSKKHQKDVSFIGGSTNRLERYRIPPKLIKELFQCMEFL